VGFVRWSRGLAEEVMHHEGGRRVEKLDYLQSMLAQLRTMAEAERCDMLAYLIEMAYLEASDLVRRERPSDVRDHQRNRTA
jgi:hypothetical protein